MSVLDDIRVVLVEPMHPGNIGGAARAMKTMGLSRLVIVSPKRFPDPQADWRAAGATDVLDAAQVVPDVASAIAQCQFVVGTSTRSRRIPWPVVDAHALAERVGEVPADTQIAILFGREDNGLTNEELQSCNYHLQIPSSPVYPSLNLAMAVQVVCYELYQRFGEREVQEPVWDRKLATAEQVDGMIEHLEAVLDTSGFLDPHNPGQTMTRMRRMFSRMQLDETEVQILRGVLKHLQ